MKVRIDPRSGDRLGNPTRVISHAPFREFDVSADGRTLAYERETPTRQIWTLTIEGPAGRTRVNARQLTSGTNQYGSPDITPDGRFIMARQVRRMEPLRPVVVTEHWFPELEMRMRGGR